MMAKPHWRILKDSVGQWLEDQPFQLAAALSYYTLFSLAPLLMRLPIGNPGKVKCKNVLEDGIAGARAFTRWSRS